MATGTLAAEPPVPTESDLVKAVCDGSLEEVKKMLDPGVSEGHKKFNTLPNDPLLIKDPTSDFPLLMLAAINGHATMCDLIIRKKASLDCVDHRGDSPLHRATVQSDLPVVEVLVARGMPVDTQSNSGLTALHYAAIRGNVGMSELLLTLGATPTVHDSAFASTPLHFAAMAVRSQWLLRPGFTSHASDAHAMSSHVRAFRLRAQGHTPLGRILINKGASLEAVTSFGDTPLHDAAGYGQAVFCKMLLRRGANPCARSNKGKTPRDYAQTRGFPACVAHLDTALAKVAGSEMAKRAEREESEREAPREERARKTHAPPPAVAPVGDSVAPEDEGLRPKSSAASHDGRAITKVTPPSATASPALTRRRSSPRASPLAVVRPIDK